MKLSKSPLSFIPDGKVTFFKKIDNLNLYPRYFYSAGKILRTIIDSGENSI